MVAPSGLADTVTPPIFSPSAELIAPDSSASAAWAAPNENAATARKASASGLCMASRAPARTDRAGGPRFTYAAIAAISSGSKWFLNPGMRGEPLAMKRAAASSPPSVAPDRTGPYCGLPGCGGVWHTRHDWLNRRMPRSWSNTVVVPLPPGSVARIALRRHGPVPPRSRARGRCSRR